MKTIVNKFGGSIFGEQTFVEASIKHIENQIADGSKPVVVVSALKGVTDQLVNLADRYSDQKIKEIEEKQYDFMEQFSLKDPSLKKKIDGFIAALIGVAKKGGGKCTGAARDTVLSYGERMSAFLFAGVLEQCGILTALLYGEELGIITDEVWGDANIFYEESVKNIRKKTQSSKLKAQNSIVPVITGFIGKTRKGQITTLGRGGSDTTACVVAAALKAEKVILWKDVPGVLSSDPRLVPHARTVSSMDYEEAEESGKVIHDKSMRYIKKEKIIVEVADVMNARKRTVITEHGLKRKGVKIVSAKDNLKLLTVTGDKIKRAGAEISDIIALRGINMVFIRNTRDNLYIVVEKNGYQMDMVTPRLSELGYVVESYDVSMVTIIGHLSWHAVERFNHLLYTYVKDTEFGAFPYRNCVRLEAIVRPKEVEKMVKIFHREFVE